MAYQAIVTTKDKSKEDKIWKDIAPSTPRRPEDLPDPKPKKSKYKQQ
jgi:hypothetical protein